MPDLLLEFLSEEIPARMQARAADDLKKMVTDRLVAAGLVYEGAKAFATPRRLTLSVHGVPARQPDLKEERKGPKVGAPEQAIAGFLARGGPRLDRSGQGAGGQEGRFLRRRDREAGQAGARGDRRDDPRGGARVSLAEVDALGRRQAHLGAPAAFDPCHVRAGDRGPGCRCVQRRRHRGLRPDARPPLHGAGRDQGAPLRRLRRQAVGRQGDARSGAARRDHPHRRQEFGLRARLRAGGGRRAAWPKWSGWWNGR